MYCPKCGAQNDDGARFCKQCGHPLEVTPSPAGGMGQVSSGSPVTSIPTYMAQAVLVTLFCCLPLGIVSIVKASQVSKCQAVGDYVGARKASDEAKTWAWISFACGFAVFFVAFVSNLSN